MSGLPPLRIVGIDPGLNITGYAVIESSAQQVKLVEAGVVRGKTKGSLAARLQEVFEGVRDVIATLSPQVMALEQLYSHYERPQTAILMGHARGVICLAAQLAGIEVQSYAATMIKKMLTGNGRAPKSQVQQAIIQPFRLLKAPEPPDVADAMAIALCHHFHRRETTLANPLLQQLRGPRGQGPGKTQPADFRPPTPDH
jgi:crossover junction endodeoxyribonuclease RuvC